MKEIKSPKSETDIDYDGKWKTLVHFLLEDLLLFLLPELHKQVDHEAGYIFLKQDLQKLVGDAYKKGDKRLDILVELKLKTGEKLPLLLHFEVEASAEVSFPERFFIYHYRLRERYPGQKIVALALYVGAKTPKVYDRYEYEEFGTKVLFKFNAFRIIDWKGKEEALLKDKNPFAIVILACLYILETKKDEERRLQFKKRLARLAFERNYPKQKTVALFEFIANLMRLSKKKDAFFRQEVLDYFKIKSNTMKSGIVPVSQQTLDLFDEIAQGLFGEKVTDLKQQYLVVKEEAKRQKEEAKRQKEEAKRQKEEVKRQKEEAKRQKEEAKRQFDIIRLHSKSKLSANEIAEQLQIELSIVKRTINEFF